MILTELYELSKQLAGNDAMPSMYGKVKIRWMIPINADGTLKGNFEDLKGATKGELRGKEYVMPDMVRSSGIKPKLLADNGEYVLGLQKAGADPKKVAERHRQYKDLVHLCAVKTQDPAVMAIDHFLATWKPEEFNQADLDPADNFTFQVYGLGGRSVIPANAVENNTVIQNFWAAHTAGKDSPLMTCLVTGIENCPVEIRLPVKIKGIPDGQTAGTSLVSANAAPFSSYGLENSLTSPISRDAAEGFGKALNYLIANKESRLYLGPVVYTFWVRGNFNTQVINKLCDEDQSEDDLKDLEVLEEADEDLLEEDQNSFQTAEPRNLLNAARSGRPQYGVDVDRFYALSLTASGGRAVVRNYINIPVSQAGKNLQAWFAAMLIVNEYGQIIAKPYLSMRRLLRPLYRDVTKDLDLSPAKLLDIALYGGKLPLDMLAQAVRRTSIEQSISHPRAALIKLILTTQLATETHNPMENMQELNLDPSFEDEKDTMAYHCGRLLAHLENIQKAALPDINTTLIDRYYSAAASTPGKVMGELVKDAQGHLRKLRVTKPAVCEALQQGLENITIKFYSAEKFPNTLNMQQQSIFALGYYHQRSASRKIAIDRKAEKEAKKALPDADTANT
jgi:CRISPR-associated protein Csd1